MRNLSKYISSCQIKYAEQQYTIPLCKKTRDEVQQLFANAPRLKYSQCKYANRQISILPYAEYGDRILSYLVKLNCNGLSVGFAIDSTNIMEPFTVYTMYRVNKHYVEIAYYSTILRQAMYRTNHSIIILHNRTEADNALTTLPGYYIDTLIYNKSNQIFKLSYVNDPLTNILCSVDVITDINTVKTETDIDRYNIEFDKTANWGKVVNGNVADGVCSNGVVDDVYSNGVADGAYSNDTALLEYSLESESFSDVYGKLRNIRSEWSFVNKNQQIIDTPVDMFNSRTFIKIKAFSANDNLADFSVKFNTVIYLSHDDYNKLRIIAENYNVLMPTISGNTSDTTDDNAHCITITAQCCTRRVSLYEKVLPIRNIKVKFDEVTKETEFGKGTSVVVSYRFATYRQIDYCPTSNSATLNNTQIGFVGIVEEIDLNKYFRFRGCLLPFQQFKRSNNKTLLSNYIEARKQDNDSDRQSEGICALPTDYIQLGHKVTNNVRTFTPAHTMFNVTLPTGLYSVYKSKQLIEINKINGYSSAAVAVVKFHKGRIIQKTYKLLNGTTHVIKYHKGTDIVNVYKIKSAIRCNIRVFNKNGALIRELSK